MFKETKREMTETKMENISTLDDLAKFRRKLVAFSFDSKFVRDSKVEPEEAYKNGDIFFGFVLDKQQVIMPVGESKDCQRIFFVSTNNERDWAFTFMLSDEDLQDRDTVFLKLQNLSLEMRLASDEEFTVIENLICEENLNKTMYNDYLKNLLSEEKQNVPRLRG